MERGYGWEIKSSVFKPFFQSTSDNPYMTFLNLGFLTLVTYLFHLRIVCYFSSINSSSWCVLNNSIFFQFNAAKLFSLIDKISSKLEVDFLFTTVHVNGFSYTYKMSFPFAIYSSMYMVLCRSDFPIAYYKYSDTIWKILVSWTATIDLIFVTGSLWCKTFLLCLS